MSRHVPTSRGTRQWTGAFIMAWSIVAGCCLVLASSLYYRTGDINVILAIVGAPFLVGTAMFMTIGIAHFANRVSRDAEMAPVRGTRQSIHRSQKR